MRSRLPDGAFLYGEYLKYVPRHGHQRAQGLGLPQPAVPLRARALRHAAPKEDTELESLERPARALRAACSAPPCAGRSPTSRTTRSRGYFYLYGHAYAAYVLSGCAPEHQRAAVGRRSSRRSWSAASPTASFWDYPLYSYHKPYGTGFALMALSRAWLFESEG